MTEVESFRSFEDDEERPDDLDYEYEVAPGEDDSSFRFDSRRASEESYAFQKRVVKDLAARAHPCVPGRRLLVRIATGGGKTRVANDWITRHVVPAGLRVLWVTKDWELLQQAARDRCQRVRDQLHRVARVGGEEHLRELREDARAQLVYTTIHTWVARRDRDFRTQHFDYIVIDEVHWGEGKPSYDKLERRYESTSTFIGLTATPRGWSDYEPVCENLDFTDLVSMGILASPRGKKISTGIRWEPERRGTHGDFTNASLSQLARSRARNDLIVRTWLENRERFGKTLVFACDIDHATRLAEAFARRGVACRELHHELTRDERADRLQAFRTSHGDQRSRLDVLVNVAMLTHGVDIPDIRTVFLARPTASPSLFLQMVGRGARKAPGKDTFNVIDFVDNLERHGDALVTANLIFGDGQSLAPGARGHALPRPRLTRHAYDFQPLEIYPGKEGYDELAGLPFQPEQTFGIEFEFTRDDFEPHATPDDWDDVAGELLDSLSIDDVAAEPLDAHDAPQTDHSVWNVEWDGSCGWEVQSPILSNVNGMEEAYDVARDLTEALPDLELTVNHRTGTHIHLGWTPELTKLRRLMTLVAYYEPALMSLVSPSRFNNPYCAPVRAVLRRLMAFKTLDDWRAHFADRDSRWLAVNPTQMLAPGGLGTLEVRLHNGTHEGPKILTWISLWMVLVSAVERGVEAPPALLKVSDLPLCKGPQGDVRDLARTIGANPELTARLEARRAQVIKDSWLSHPRYGALAARVRASWKLALPKLR